MAKIAIAKETKEDVPEVDRRVLELGELPDGFDFDHAFAILFDWCQAAFTRIESMKSQ